MAPSIMTQTLRASAVAFTALSTAPLTAPATAQTVYREYEDGGGEPWLEEEERGYSAAPQRRQRPQPYDEDEDDRFERDDEDGDDRDGDEEDLSRREAASDRREAFNGAPEVSKKAPVPPPSVDAKPDEKAWKPAL